MTEYDELYSTCNRNPELYKKIRQYFGDNAVVSECSLEDIAWRLSSFGDQYMDQSFFKMAWIHHKIWCYKLKISTKYTKQGIVAIFSQFNRPKKVYYRTKIDTMKIYQDQLTNDLFHMVIRLKDNTILNFIGYM